MVRERFALFDRNKDGKLDTVEVRAMMASMGYEVTVEYVAQLFESFDSDKSGELQVQEFERLLGFLLSDSKATVHRHDTYRDRFSHFDKDGDAKLDSDEVTAMLISMGYNINKEYVLQMMDVFDLDKSGFIEVQEFEKLMAHLLADTTSNRIQRSDTVDERFRRFDADGDGQLSTAEVISMMASMGYAVDEAYATQLIEKFGDQDGNVGFKECESILAFLGTDTSGSVNTRDTYRERFVHFDTDGDNKIGFVEASSMMISLGFNVDDEYLKKLFEQFDKDASGFIDAHEFEVMLGFLLGDTHAHTRGDVTKRDTLGERFGQADADGDGNLSIAEATSVVVSMGYDVGIEYMATLITEADPEKSEQVSLLTFGIVFGKLVQGGMMRRDSLMDRFASFDDDKDGRLLCSEAENLIRSMGTEFDEARVHKIVEDYCTENNGSIDYKTFEQALVVLLSGTGTAQEIDDAQDARKQFLRFDTNADGLLTTDEFHALMASLGYDIANSNIFNCDAMCEMFNIEKGRIQFEDFEQMLDFLVADYGVQVTSTAPMAERMVARKLDQLRREMEIITNLKLKELKQQLLQEAGAASTTSVGASQSTVESEDHREAAREMRDLRDSHHIAHRPPPSPRPKAHPVAQEDHSSCDDEDRGLRTHSKTYEQLQRDNEARHATPDSAEDRLKSMISGMTPRGRSTPRGVMSTPGTARGFVLSGDGTPRASLSRTSSTPRASPRRTASSGGTSIAVDFFVPGLPHVIVKRLWQAEGS